MGHSILAALLAATALIPGAAMAQRSDDGRRGDRGFDRDRSGVAVDAQGGIERGRLDRPARAERAQQPDQPQPQFRPRSDRGDDGARADRGGRERGDDDNRGGGFDPRGQSGFQPAPAPVPVAQADRGFRGADRSGDVRVNRGGDAQRRGNDDRGGRPAWRNDRPQGNAEWRGNDNRGGNQWRGNDRRPDIWYDRGRGNQGNWNRGWRQDDRYDWNRRRQVNRNAFHLPRYYAPSGWGYGYRRFNIGITLSSGLFGRNYWIDDADYYGLPEAYGPYRWVRYYNDALLVDIYSGQVVDTVYDIFW